ncbi:MAG TPA: TIGR03435 family protein [Bryobacteraceae bacterium]|jgi:uncharacterized protein (TIGR03435 family)|nr:TIGR03435 family protein [Bryobacteraceae bacterium]
MVMRTFYRFCPLVFAAIAALAGPVIIGFVGARPGRAQSQPTARPAFEVASVKLYKDDGVGPRNAHSTYNPQGIDLGARTIGFIISEAYQFPPGLMVVSSSLPKDALRGPPSYDILAKADHPVPKEQLRLMLQSLLADRFKLALHRETKTGPVYKLVIAKGGSKLEESEGGDLTMAGSVDGLVFRNAEVFRLAGYLSSFLDRIVVDETGLKRVYNFTVKAPEELRQNPVVKSEGRAPDSQSAALFADVLKPLGLQLIAATAPVEYLVVDHVERPSEN